MQTTRIRMNDERIESQDGDGSGCKHVEMEYEIATKLPNQIENNAYWSTTQQRKVSVSDSVAEHLHSVFSSLVNDNV